MVDILNRDYNRNIVVLQVHCDQQVYLFLKAYFLLGILPIAVKITLF